MEKLLEINSLSKSFKGNLVLDNISFSIEKGEVLCLLGPNGAGKSTTINILLGLLGRDSGTITYDGKVVSRSHLRAYKQKLGVVPQDLALYEELSAQQNARFFTSLYGLRGPSLDEAVEEALKFAGLTDRRKDKVKTFSGGMKRRLNIACAIAHHPELVIMDEPTVGIDPQSRNHILDSIKKLQANGITILYTTHYMEEVEAISSRIIIIDHGKIIAEGTKEKLKENIQSEKCYHIELEEGTPIPTEGFYDVEGVKEAKSDGNKIDIVSLRGVENLDRIISLISDAGAHIRNIAGEEASLETVFLKLTGRKLRD
ncbi:ABC transporter ATP-binding protein [Caproicibacterium sp. NSD3]